MEEPYQDSKKGVLNMSEKRKDKNGRILQKGESQRKDGIYQYRYTDSKGKRQCIYASDLKELRNKEKEIQKIIDKGGDYVAGNITVSKLVERYFELKQNLRMKTKELYTSKIKFIQKMDFGNLKIKDIKTSQAKKWVIELSEQGFAYGNIKTTCAILYAAFQMAVEEDILVKNPFNFHVQNVIEKNTKKRTSLTDEQQKIFLDYVYYNSKFSKYYDELVFLLETGLRVSEMCGLTVEDVDLDEKCIILDKQLLKDSHGNYYIEYPKTESGNRKIPLSMAAFDILKRRIEEGKYLTNIIIDGKSRFIFFNTTKVPRTAHNYDYICRTIMKSFNRDYPHIYMPAITPHILRHTYCSNMQKKNINPKILQYLMGHAHVDLTLNTYSHSHYGEVIESLSSIPEYNQEA